MKKVEAEIDDDLLPEYDLKSLRIRKLGPGRKSFGRVAGMEPDVAGRNPKFQVSKSIVRPSVFIGHSSVDKPFVRRLVTQLNNDGVETWLDELEIRIGESIHQKVNEGLKRSDFFIVVLSQASVKSPWVQEELSSAAHIEKYAAKGVFILPILLEECDVPPLLLDRRYANLKDDPESAYQELLDSLYHHFSRLHPGTNLSHIPNLELNATLMRGLGRDSHSFSDLAPRHFEELVAQLLSRKGFNVTLTAATRDGGFDIVAESRALSGLSALKLLVQCKRVARPIGSDDIRQLLGTLMVHGGDRVVFVTSSYFTKAARQIAQGHPIDLVDAQKLSEWIREIDDSEAIVEPVN